MKRECLNPELLAIANDIKEIKTHLLVSKTVFNPQEAAQYLGVAVSTIYKMTSAGILPFSKPNNKLIYFSRNSLDQWLLRNQTKGHEQLETEAATFVSAHTQP